MNFFENVCSIKKDFKYRFQRFPADSMLSSTKIFLTSINGKQSNFKY